MRVAGETQAAPAAAGKFVAMSWARCALVLAACAVLAACGQSSSSRAIPTFSNTPEPLAGGGIKGKNGIDHIIVVVQENRSFDNLFHGFPGADTASRGLRHDGTSVPLVSVPLSESYDIEHGEQNFLRAYDNGRNDGFDIEDPTSPTHPYGFVQQSDVQPYWDLAKKYVIADETFASQIDGSFSAHQYLIAGQSGSAVDNPNALPWGCDAPSGTGVPTLNPDRSEGAEIFPCFNYESMAAPLDAAKATWRYYAPPVSDVGGQVWSGFDAISAVREGLDWNRNVVTPETTFLSDVAGGQLANVSWVIPDFVNSDHAGNNSNSGPQWVTSVVNAVGNSGFWKDSVVIVLWDDWGGWYDHVPPQYVDPHGLGFRVPLMVISPYAKTGYVSHVHYEFGSVLKLIETTFGLKPLAASDARSNPLDDCFAFGQPSRPFAAIRTKRSPQSFTQEIPSGKPPDTE